MVLLAILISLVNAYLIARYARNKFALTLSGSFLLSAFAIASYFSIAFKYNLMSSGIYWGIIVVTALLIFFLSNPLRHFITWLFVLMILILVVILPFEIKINQTTSLIISIIAAIPVYIYRNEIKWILVGLMSGINLAMGLLILLYTISPLSMFSVLTKVSSLLYLSGATAGVYFQFKLYDKYFAQNNLEQPNL
jgi:hypothetical protein